MGRSQSEGGGGESALTEKSEREGHAQSVSDSQEGESNARIGIGEQNSAKRKNNLLPNFPEEWRIPAYSERKQGDMEKRIWLAG